MWRSIWTSCKNKSTVCNALTLILLFVKLPLGATAMITDMALQAEPILLATNINGLDTGKVVSALKLNDDSIAISEQDVRLWNMTYTVTSTFSVDDQRYVRLDDILGSSYEVDAKSQTLLLKISPSAFPVATITYGNLEKSTLTPSQLGGFFNYDLQWQRAESSDNSNGLLEAGIFNDWGSGTSTGLWNTANTNRSWVRLDTIWNIDMPDRMQSLRLGDTISTSGSWGRAVRYGGIKWTSNFSTQPGFISFPLSTMRGEAVVPSTLDVYVNNVRSLHSNVPQGPFDLSNIPIVTGQGEIQLVVHDILGRQQVINKSYFVSSRLLRPGLHDFTYEAGVVRENYGIDNANYGKFILIGNDRHGISETFSRELRAEVMNSQQTIGVGGVWLLSNFGTFNLNAAISHENDRVGRTFSVGIEHQSKDFSFNLQDQYADREFVQIGLVPEFSPRHTFSASMSFPLKGNGLGIGYLQQSTWENGNSRVLSASYSMRLNKIGQLGFYSLSNFSGDHIKTFGFIFTHVFDDRTSLSTDFSHTGSQSQASQQLQRNLPAGNGFGYRLMANESDSNRFAASGIWQTNQGTFTTEASRFSNSDSYRVGMSGGIAIAGGSAFMSRRIDDSFGVVKVGNYPNVRIYRDNQEVTRSNAHGLALVTHLRAYQKNPIGIEQADLPMEAEVDTLQIQLTPALRSGVVADFPVRRIRSATFRLVGEDDMPLPPGATVRVQGQDKEFPVGYDGNTFVTGIGLTNRLYAKWAGQHCIADLTLANEKEILPYLGTWTCINAMQ